MISMSCAERGLAHALRGMEFVEPQAVFVFWRGGGSLNFSSRRRRVQGVGFMN